MERTPGTLIRHLPEGQPEKPGIPPLNSSVLGQSLRCSPASSRPQPRLIHKSHFLEVTLSPALRPFHCPDPSNTLAPKGERSVKPDIQIEICVIFKAAGPTLSLKASPAPFLPALSWSTCSLTPAFQRGEQQAGLWICAPFLSCLGGPWLPAFLGGSGVCSIAIHTGVKAWIWVSLQPCDQVACPLKASPFTWSRARPQRAPHVK